MGASSGAATVFVTDPLGFVGRAILRFLVARGHDVLALTRTFEDAERARRLGARAVMGDLATPGCWQDEAAADWVFHLAPLSSCYARARRFGAGSQGRTSLDEMLLDAIGAGATRRFLYVADAACYGANGARPITEDESIRPSRAQRWIVPALDRLDGHALAGLPIVTAFLGCAYGNGSWLRELVVDPILAGRRVIEFGRVGPLVSPIHVRDCARALVHLAGRGAVEGRYFVVNRDAVLINDFARTFARLAHRPLHLWRLPVAVARALVPPSLAGHLYGDSAFSNIRLRATGFEFEFPTVEHGLQQVLDTL
jgi:nucleoside-diphosphate-sugar epimerase